MTDEKQSDDQPPVDEIHPDDRETLEIPRIDLDQARKKSLRESSEHKVLRSISRTFEKY